MGTKNENASAEGSAQAPKLLQREREATWQRKLRLQRVARSAEPANLDRGKVAGPNARSLALQNEELQAVNQSLVERNEKLALEVGELCARLEELRR